MLPESLKIGFEVYRVGNATDDAGNAGECSVEMATIQLKPGTSVRRRLSTLLHEILHALWDQAELPHGDADIGGLKEEDVISRMTAGLTQVLLDNPGLRSAIERAAGDTNGTCLKPGWFKPGELEQIANIASVQRGIVERSVDSCVNCKTLTINNPCHSCGFSSS